MLSGKSTLDRARLAVPAITIRSSRLLWARASSALLRATPGAARWAGPQPASTAARCCGSMVSGVPADARQEPRTQVGEGVVPQFLADVDDPLLNLAGVGDQDHQDLAGGQQHEFDVAHHGAAQVRVLHDGDLVGQLGQEPCRPVQDVVEVLGSFQQRLDGPALRRRQRLDGRNLVHEEPVALVGGDPSGAGVRGHDEALVLQRSHVVADGGAGNAQMVPFHQGLGADGFAGMDVVLHDGAQHFEFAWFAHTPPPIDRSCAVSPARRPGNRIR